MEKNQSPHALYFEELKALKPAYRYDGKEPFAEW